MDSTVLSILSGAVVLGALVTYLSRKATSLRDPVKEQKRVHNPFNCIHAAALCTFAETVGGLAVFSQLTKKDRAIVTKINMEYLKKARGLITAICQFNLEEVSEQPESECEVTLRDETLDIVAKATIFWQISRKD